MNRIAKEWNIIKALWRKASYLIFDSIHKTQEHVLDFKNLIQSYSIILDVEKMKKVVA